MGLKQEGLRPLPQSLGQVDIWVGAQAMAQSWLPRDPDCADGIVWLAIEVASPGEVSVPQSSGVEGARWCCVPMTGIKGVLGIWHLATASWPTSASDPGKQLRLK